MKLAGGRQDATSWVAAIDVQAHQFVVWVLRPAHAGPGHHHDRVLRHDDLGGGRGGLGVVVAAILVVLPVEA